MRGIERRIAAGLDPRVSSVASLFVSRWDRAVAGKVPQELAQSAGHRRRDAHLPGALRAAGRQTLARSRGRRSEEAAHVVGEHRHEGSEGIARRCTSRRWRRPTPSTPCRKRRCWRSPQQGQIESVMPADGGDAEDVLARFAAAGIDVDALARKLQVEGAQLLRQVLDRTHAKHRRQERGAGRIVSPRIDPLAGQARAGRSPGGRAAADHRLLQRAPGSGGRRTARRLRHLRTSRQFVRIELQRIPRARDHPGDLRLPQAARHRRAAVHRLRHPCAVRAGIRAARSRCSRRNGVEVMTAAQR